MGWANIANGGSDGLYSIDLDLGTDIVQKRIGELTSLINTLQTVTIPANQTALNAATAEVNLWKDVLNIRIGQMNTAIAAGDKAEEESIRKGINGTTVTALAERREKERQAREVLTRSKFELAALQKELQQKQSIETYRQQDAWCVDLTEDASGIVATCEVPGEPTYVLVAPGARAPETGDGALLARGAMTGPQAYWNSAVLPGWQKWKPDYRAGIISDINHSTDRARVTLLPIKSSAQGLNINRVDVLNAVPIEYMTCNAAAFEEGDSVVVRFDGRSWSNPKIIGFLDHPKPCWRLAYFFRNETSFAHMTSAEIQPAGQNWIIDTTYLVFVFGVGCELRYGSQRISDGHLRFTYQAFPEAFHITASLHHQPSPLPTTCDEFLAQSFLPFLVFTEFRMRWRSLPLIPTTESTGYYGFMASIDSRQTGKALVEIWLTTILLEESVPAGYGGLFRCFDYQPDPYPIGNTPQQIFFQVPQQDGQIWDTKVKAVFTPGSQKLYVNGQLVATLTNNYATSWHEFERINISALVWETMTDSSTWPSCDEVTVR